MGGANNSVQSGSGTEDRQTDRRIIGLVILAAVSGASLERRGFSRDARYGGPHLKCHEWTIFK